MKVVVEDEGFVVTERRSFGRRKSRVVRFADISAVAAEKVGKISYDEVFLIIHEASGEGCAVGELDEGFADFEQALRKHLKNYRSDWWETAEEGPTGSRLHVWPSQKASPAD